MEKTTVYLVVFLVFASSVPNTISEAYLCDIKDAKKPCRRLTCSIICKLETGDRYNSSYCSEAGDCTCVYFC
ncbi:hypothetical protein HPP92_014189 [Vanilla planifolia]|uniref:Uncharacterized protein n=1 Tax=Vanilla planifolia TaxID=51239 RepID=A0A835QZP3_VANPL|nr:hypothetical protein HPP92_014189 [Vanilla planifolia]